MSDCMHFPDTVEEFMEEYKLVDTEQVYTNGTELVPIFRMKQWFEHEKAQLSQEDTTKDAISRQAAIDAVNNAFDRETLLTGFVRSIAVRAIRDMPSAQPVATDTDAGDTISKFIDGLEEIFADLRERHVDDSVCGLCEYDGAYMGQSGDWCNECPGFDRDDCFKLSEETRKKWTDEIIKALPTVQPERKKGEWIEISSINHTYKCSECGRLLVNVTDGKNNVSKHYPYCHCGADMRGERQK